jgi:hypothetical protein
MRCASKSYVKRQRAVAVFEPFERDALASFFWSLLIKGSLVTFKTVGSLVQDVNHLSVAFKNQFELDSAFMSADIYLRDVFPPRPRQAYLPIPRRNCEV